MNVLVITHDYAYYGAMTVTQSPPRIVADTTAIRALRYELGLNIAQFAKLAGISQGLMSRIENGRIEGSPAALRKIADATGKKVADITRQVPANDGKAAR